MSLAFIISLAIQVTLIVHCIRTGRSWLWMLAIGLLPFAGSVAYVLVEVLPDLFRGAARSARCAGCVARSIPGRTCAAMNPKRA